jgi:hypothetical protein
LCCSASRAARFSEVLRWASRAARLPDARLEFFVDVAGDDHHFLDDLLLVEKLGKGFLEPGAQFFQFARQLLPAAFLLGLLPGGILFIHLLILRLDFFDELVQILEVLLAIGDFFVNNDAVKALLGRLGQQFFRNGDVLLRREAEAVNNALHLHLRVLNLFADLDFLLARQQGNLAHLVHVHPHRVIQNFQPGLLVHLFRLGLFRLGALGALGALDLGLVHDDFHVQIAQLGQQRIQFFRDLNYPAGCR